MPFRLAEIWVGNFKLSIKADQWHRCPARNYEHWFLTLGHYKKLDPGKMALKMQCILLMSKMLEAVISL